MRTLQIGLVTSHLFVVALFSATALGQAAAVDPPGKPGPRVVVARVNDEPLYADQIEEQLKKTLGGSLPAEPLRPRALAQMLEQAIRQRLVEEFLVRGTPGLSVRDLDALVESLEDQTKKKGQKFKDYLVEQGLTEKTLRKRWAWTLGWSKYLETQLTDDRLIRGFVAHRAQLDGTQVRAAQLLVKVEEPVTPEKQRAAVERAAKIRKLIVDGKLSFADAVRDYSQAPSAEAGGDLGFVTREDLPESVGAALIKLKVGEISEPVTSPFGVHLVTATAIKPGEKSWQDAREGIKKILTAELFAEIAAAERPAARIEYTGAMPYLAADGTLVEKK
jgi:parvulin-like peptidyl-prolyl isomerase